MSHDRKAEAEQLFMAGQTIAAIAAQLSVSRRTIERWADDGVWREKRGNVVSINQPPKTQPVNNPNPTPTREPARVRRRDRGTIDELEIIENAIVNLDLLLSGMSSTGEERSIDTRGIGTTAGALVKLLEYRRKIQPPTAAELAEQAIALGMSPAEFARELRQAWEKRA